MLKNVVTAPYVMLKVRDDVLGGVTVREFYKGAVLPDGADKADVERLRGKGMLGQVEFPDPEPVVPQERLSGSQKGAENSSVAATGKPAGNASRDDWAAYAAATGAPQDDTRPVDQGGLSRDDLRAKYGNGG